MSDTVAPTHHLRGTIDRVVFHNAENGFAIFILTAEKQTHTIQAMIPAIRQGELISVSGQWNMHPKFGKQFIATQYTIHPPTSAVGLKKYLSSGLIKGIGPIYAQKLVNFFGADVLEIIDKHPEQLTRVPGIGAKRIEAISNGWHEQKEIAQVMVFLQEKGISPTYATKMYKKYGTDTIAIVTSNPYRLAQDVWGIGFKIADQIAQSLGVAPASKNRIQAGVIHVLKTATNTGHVYLAYDDALKKAEELLAIPENQLSSMSLTDAFDELIAQGAIKKIDHQEKPFVALTQHYATERSIASRLKELLSYKMPTTLSLDTIRADIQSWSTQSGIALHENQQDAVCTSLTSKVSVITGGPGTGKTTVIKTILAILKKHKLTYQLAAPTGRAAKRITQSCGAPASTIHRLLEFDASRMSFTKNETNPLAHRCIIVDESSMIDIFLAHALIKAVPLDALLIFIGDVDQLPSVGPGNFLHDVIESGIIPTSRFSHIFRQAHGSTIVTNAHRINQGEFPLKGSDFIFIQEDDPTQLPIHLEALYTHFKRSRITLADTVVLTPMHRGPAGTQALNHHLQTIINPPSSQQALMYAGISYRVGDRVMQLRNNYDKLVFNGDVGVIEKIDIENQQITVNFTDQSILYEKSDMDELTLAYALSIHKSQGSEYPVVIVLCFVQHYILLARNVIYTAVTRAKTLCICIGQPRALGIALSNNRGRERITLLKQFLAGNGDV